MLDAFIKQRIIVHYSSYSGSRASDAETILFFLRLGSVKQMNIREASINIVPEKRRTHLQNALLDPNILFTVVAQEQDSALCHGIHCRAQQQQHMKTRHAAAPALTIHCAPRHGHQQGHHLRSPQLLHSSTSGTSWPALSQCEMGTHSFQIQVQTCRY